MSKRNISLIATCGALLAVALVVLPSLTARAIVACLMLLSILFLRLGALITTKSSRYAYSKREKTEVESSQEIALGKLFEATMSGMREGLLVVDQDMRVVAANSAAHRLFNFSGRKQNSQRLTELTRNPAIYGAFLDALKGTERSGVKVEMHGPERSVFDLRVVPLDTANGMAAGGALGVFFDVTRIERLEGVRQEFLSNVSHELRTPLTAILAFVETLESGALADKESAERFLAIIRKNAFRMHDLIDDILELSAIEAGNVQVKAEQIELYPLVNDVISSLATKADSRGVVITNAVPRDATVLADARRLEQMLNNLVDNAIKFNRREGNVTIRFEIEVPNEVTKDATSGRERIIVEDTGEGIPAQHLHRLFERFYRVDRARSRELGGTGLGLAIVKHLARAHGGEVSVISELGKGSIFTIELPQTLNSQR